MKALWIGSRETQPPRAVMELTGSVFEECDTARDPWDGFCRLKTCSYDVLLATVPIAGWSAEGLLEQAQSANRSVPVVFQHQEPTIAEVVRLTKLGAHAVLGPGPTAEELAAVVESLARPRQAAGGAWRERLVGDSEGMQRVADVVALVGPRKSTVLITGETGTGKEMVARAIHQASPRAHLPMVAVNCSALPENLLEAELFGHVKGAFTGAMQQRAGRFEQAHGSTIFLDEVGEIPLETQAKLLRVLQEREFQRLGSGETIKVDVRVIAATNVDLVQRIRQGKFREDLYYRLNVVPIQVPPLRERPRDIPLLVRHFIEKVCRQEEVPLRRVTSETLDRLMRYEWPGNVRQLENAVEMAVALSGESLTLYPGDFRLPVASRPPDDVRPATPYVALPDDGLDFEHTVNTIERDILEQALSKTGGNKSQAAEMLRLKRTTLAAKLKSLAMTPERWSAAHAQ